MFADGWRPPPTDAILNKISQEFTYGDLAEATNNFSQSFRLGEGTYGTVFRGVLRDGTEVAIKALAQPKEGGFREEVEVLSRFRHPNLVILMGFARNRRERYLVYELLPGGDLNSRMGKDAMFQWWQRLNVVTDAALGLSHLHGSRPQVFHRDVKTQNILMDKNGTGKVADFGLACLAQPNQQSLVVSQASGTIGYADPLYIQTGVVTEKSEVYSMGMVFLEVLTGRPPALQHPSGKIEYQFDRINGELKRLQPMVDMRAKWPPVMVERLGGLALQCTCENESYRPSFVEIVTQLRNWLREEPPPQMPPSARPPGYTPGAGSHQGWIGPADGGPQNRMGNHEPYIADDIIGRAGWGSGVGAMQVAPGAYGQTQQQQQQPPWPSGHGAVAAATPQVAAQHVAVAAHRVPSPQVVPILAAGQQPDLMKHSSAERERRPSNPIVVPAGASVQHRNRPVGASSADAYVARPNNPSLAGAHLTVQHPEPANYGSPVPRVDCGRPSPTHAAQADSPPFTPDKEKEIAMLEEMGYDRKKAVEAFKRTSTIEAAINWIHSSE